MTEFLERILEEWRDGFPVHVRTDFDGTLTDFIDFPDESVPLPRAVPALERVAGLPLTTAGIVTGRPLDFAIRHFRDAAIELDCSYGAETRHDGVIRRAPWIVDGQPALDEMQHALVAKLAAAGCGSSTSSREAATNGWIYVERAPAKLAFHVRGGEKTNPQLADLLSDAAAHLEDSFGLTTSTNAGNIEYALPTPDGNEINKSAVFARLLGVGAPDRPNFVLFTGDDRGDLEAAQLVHENGGVVLTVRHDETPGDLVNIADLVFESPHAHVTFLDRLSRDLEGLSRELSTPAPEG